MTPRFALLEARVTRREELARGYVRLDLAAPELVGAGPGQFVHVACREPEAHDPLLRRPLAVADARPRSGEVTLVLRVAGRGTAWLARRQAGDVLDVMGPLGRGFSLGQGGGFHLLVGGGTGVPPLLLLARRLAERGATVWAVLGFREASQVILVHAFESVGARVVVATDDGSLGVAGTAADAAASLWPRAERVYGCGPWGLLHALHRRNAAGPRRPLEVSVEAMMGCGAGVCLSCVVPRAEPSTSAAPGGARPALRGSTGWLRACREGPVFAEDELDWERCPVGDRL